MARTITFNIPVETGKGKSKSLSVQQATGEVMLATIGERRVRFVLQHDPDGEPTCLTHWASGHRIGQLNPIKLRYAMSYRRLTSRAAAKILLHEVLERHGEQKVLEIFDQAPVINR